MTLIDQISHAERQVVAAKFRIKDLQTRARQKADQQIKCQAEILKAKRELEEKRIHLAKLIANAYNLAI